MGTGPGLQPVGVSPLTPERGKQVQLPTAARLAVRGLGYFTWPLRIDDYLELITPLWSVEELRGRIERVHRETDDAVTVFITPGFRWRGHQPGQYVRIGFDIEGKRHWRAYSLSSDAARPDGQMTITVKRTDNGVVSQIPEQYVRPPAPSSRSATSKASSRCRTPHAAKLLFLTAGSGITPVMAMLRSLGRRGECPDVVHIHSARTQSEAIFAGELEGWPNGTMATGSRSARPRGGRLKPESLDEVCPDWRERETYACGPGAMLDALRAHFKPAGVSERLHVESFEHIVLAGVTGEGGTDHLRRKRHHCRMRWRDSRSWWPARTPVPCSRTAAGWASATPAPARCATGRCAICAPATLTRAGTEIRTCVNSPDGDITIEL